jgi:hypothetical protein
MQGSGKKTGGMKKSTASKNIKKGANGKKTGGKK